jgi:signal transduction histidine kinase
VLVVEDEPEVADVLEFNLKKAGYQVLLAPDGLTACRLVAERRPDLILLDILLPDLDGWEICRMIRSHPDPVVGSTPVLLLTALGSAEDRIRGLALGADDYVPKPFSVKEVLLRLEGHLRRRREAQDLSRRLDRSEAARRADADIQSLLFHELRNKMLVIGGFSGRLAARPGSGEESARYARVIRSASEYLGALAEQVLLLRKVEAGALELPCQDTDPADAVRAVADLHGSAAEEKGVGLAEAALGPGALARANPLALRVCLSNLVENAVRYSPSGATVRVAWGRDGERAYVEVHDDGPGIPEDEQERVFERFYRGRGAAGEAGSGLGLYVVKTLIQAMGGEVLLVSRPGRGTRIRLSFPRSSSAERAMDAKTGSSPPPATLRTPAGAQAPAPVGPPALVSVPPPH